MRLLVQCVLFKNAHFVT